MKKKIGFINLRFFYTTRHYLLLKKKTPVLLLYERYVYFLTLYVISYSSNKVPKKKTFSGKYENLSDKLLFKSNINRYETSNT